MQLKNILITGANGQVGSEFKAIEKSFPQYNFIFASKENLCISDETSVNVFFEKNNIHYCINCAAYTAVDKAEQENTTAILVNETAVGYLAKACTQFGSKFIHISTDYVFDGKATFPYKENSETNPVNFYGQTKLNGEHKALQENADCIVIRTAWVYSSFGNNFVKTMLRLMSERPSIAVVNDQFGSPTYGADLAAAIMKIITQSEFTAGIYHYTNTGGISWFDFAKEIASYIKSDCMVNSITTAQYPTPAARPSYSVLDTTKIAATFNIIVPEWKVSLHKCLTLLTN